MNDMSDPFLSIGKKLVRPAESQEITEGTEAKSQTENAAGIGDEVSRIEQSAGENFFAQAVDSQSSTAQIDWDSLNLIPQELTKENPDWSKIATSVERLQGLPTTMEREITDLREQLNSIGDDAQLANVDLQNILQKQQQTLQMMSNISKMLFDTISALVRMGS